MKFSDLVINLRLQTQAFTTSMNNVRKQAQRFASYLGRVSKDGAADDLIRGYTSLNDRLHTVGLSLRDIARVSSGIMISQTFYTITRSIREATGALWEFNKELDYAHVTYSSLFADSNLASDFIDTLKDFSVDTIFEYSDIEGMARKLSAYGIEAQNLMYIIEGLTNIGTVSGDSAALERLAVAIGQINAKGTLKAEEMRQLANAYTPIYDILREKLHLTEEQLASVGDLGIKSADAINAIIEYANETFGDTAEAAVFTIKGLNNKIVDSLKVMGSNIMRPVTTFYKSLAKYIADQLGIISDIFDSSGLGGVFEYLVPSKEWQQRIRTLLASIHNMFATLIQAFMSLWPYIKQFIGGFIDALSLFISILNSAVTGIMGFVHTLERNGIPVLKMLTTALITAAAAWMLFKVQAIGAAIVGGLKVVFVGVAKAITLLTVALAKNPIIGMLMLFGAVLIGVAANANNANNAISKLINSFNSYSGSGTVADDILQAGDAMEEGTTNSDKFWESMEGGAEDAGDAVDGAGNKAKKAAKSLLSFDEVFSLNEKDDASSGLGAGALEGLGELTDMMSGLGGALIPEIPDFSDFASNFVNNLKNDLWEAIKTIASGAGTGALIGGLVGFVIGGLVTKKLSGALTGASWGAKIGTIAGAAFAGFWTDTYNELEGSLQKIGIGAAIGTLVGGLVGLVIGAFATKSVDGALAGARLGATIGTLIGGGIGAFWAAGTEEMNNAIEGIVVGAASGALLGGIAGLIIGAFATKTLSGALQAASLGTKIGVAVGGTLGGILGACGTSFKTAIEGMMDGVAAMSEGALIGGLAGMLVGAVIGSFMGGQALAGAKMGAKIGALIGGSAAVIAETAIGDTERSIADRLKNVFNSVSAMGQGALIGGLAGMLIGAIIGVFVGGQALAGAGAGAKIGAAIGGLIGGAVGLLMGDAEKSIKASLENFMADVEAMGIGAFIGGMVGMGIGAVVGALIGGQVIPGMKIGAMLGGAIGGLAGYVASWLDQSGIADEITKWFGGIFEDITILFSDIGAAISDLFSGTDVSLGDFIALIGESLNTFFGNIAFDTATLFANIGSILDEQFPGLRDKVSTWIADRLTDVTTFCTNLKTTITTWFSDRLTDLTTFFTGVRTSISNWLTETKTNISTWFSDRKRDIREWWQSWFDYSKWVAGWRLVVTWFTNLRNEMSSWFTKKKADIATFWSGLFNKDNWKSGWSMVKGWFADLLADIRSWFSSIGSSIASWWDGLWDLKMPDISAGIGSLFPDGVSLGGHATGGIFDKEHIARFAEGGKAEAVIPLENASAMQPFVDAISNGILQGILPTLVASGGGHSDLPPMYVGTLIADERGLEQLNRKLNVIQAKEQARKGF